MTNLSRRGFFSAVVASTSLAGMAACSQKKAETSTAATTSATSVETTKQERKPEEDASGFVLLADMVPSIIQEVRYYTTYNFTGDRIDGYEQPVVLLTREAAEALARAAEVAEAQGYRFKVFDGYRPQRAVDFFVKWSKDVNDTRMKPYFYPDLDKSVLFDQVYIAEKSGHTRGSTLDLTLFDMKTEREVDMGGTFDFFGERSHPDFTGITDEQYALRMVLRNIMIDAGFKPLETEWWHFTLNNEPYPDTYFTFPVNVNSVKRGG